MMLQDLDLMHGYVNSAYELLRLAHETAIRSEAQFTYDLNAVGAARQTASAALEAVEAALETCEARQGGGEGGGGVPGLLVSLTRAEMDSLRGQSLTISISNDGEATASVS